MPSKLLINTWWEKNIKLNIFIYYVWLCFNRIMPQPTTSTIISHLPIAFLFGMILLNNIMFAYILMSDCFLKTNENLEID